MKKTMTLIGALALPLQLHAADLASVYRAALENDAVFAEAKAKFEATQQRIPISRAGLLPVVTASGNTFWNDQDEFRNPPKRTDPWKFNSNGYTLSLTQPLFRWQNWVGYDQSKMVVAQAEAGLASAQQDLILRVSQAYFEVLYARELLKAAQALQSAVGSQLKFASDAFDVGTGVKTDVHDAQARYAFANSQVIAAETELEVRQRALESIIGSVPEQLASRRQGASLSPPQPLELNKWVDAAGQTNLTVQQQQLAVEIAGREVDKQRAGHLPTLDLVASTGRTSTLNSGVREITDADRVGLQLNVPIFQGGEVVARQSEASANRRAATSALESAKRGAVLLARQSYLGVTNGLAQIKVMEQALVASQEALESTKAGMEVGIRLGIDVLNAQNQVFTARRDLTRVTVDTLLAQLKLKAAVGTLGEADVMAVNTLLDSAAK